MNLVFERGDSLLVFSMCFAVVLTFIQAAVGGIDHIVYIIF